MCGRVNNDFSYGVSLQAIHALRPAMQSTNSLRLKNSNVINSHFRENSKIRMKNLVK